MVLPPPNIRTVVNGEVIGSRAPMATGRGMLMTEAVDEEGRLHRPHEFTDVRVYAPQAGEKAHLYEMGIPIVELPEDTYHVSVEQKVPLSLERDAVTPYYLQTVRA